MRLRHALRSALASGALLAAVACAPVAGPGTAALPPVRPVVPPAPPPVPPPDERSQASRDLELYYARLQQSLLDQGLLRRDRGGVDAPFDARRLAEAFVEIALFDEYRRDGGVLRAERTESRLRRWEQPVRMQVAFGDTVPPERRITEAGRVAAYAAQLSRATGLEITPTERSPNFHVLFLGEDDRAAFVPELRRIVPGISDAAVRAFRDMPRETLCLVFAFSRGESFAYTKAVAVIRAEHPDLLTLSCIHEELAQGLGLANDSPAARPSIFNDDEEFALLTRHDELLLAMLYDPRMRPGMKAAEAGPIARQIAGELLGGES